MPPIVSFVGRPDCGKTTLLEKLLPELSSRGLKVGTIKHHVHEFQMDKPGKDTWRHKQAGAHTVVLSSPTGLGLIKDVAADSAVEELAARYFSDVDLVLTEGYKRLDLPKIEVFRSELYEESLERDDSWVAIIADRAMDTELPCFDPNDAKGVADFLIERFITPFAKQKTSLVVNGKPIALNSFVESFLRKAVTGMTRSLKGCDNPTEILLTIRQESDDD